MRGMENQANPWGVGQDKREDWAEGLGVKTFAHIEAEEEGREVDYLFWVNRRLLDAAAGLSPEAFASTSGDTVRVVQVGDFSTEFCGGTHVQSTAQIGEFARLSASLPQPAPSSFMVRSKSSAKLSP